MGDERRAPVQANQRLKKPGGTIAWWEHEKAWDGYAERGHGDQSAEVIAQRFGFCYAEVTEFLGHEPTTFVSYEEARKPKEAPNR